MESPFSIRRMIKDPSDFFGRKEELYNIYSFLKKKQSVSIVGDRRIGKSSLLYNIYLTGNEELSDDNYKFVYVNLQDANYHSAQNFFKEISKLINIEFIPADNLMLNLIKFSDILEQIEGREIVLVLMCDEFENLIKRIDEFTSEFFEHLRYEIDMGNLCMITASCDSIKDLCMAGECTSPFYNVFSTLKLDVLKEEEVDELIFAERKENVKFNDKEVQFIKNQKNYRHPLLLQIICDWTFKNRIFKHNNKKLQKKIENEAKSFFEKGVGPIIKRSKRYRNAFNKVGHELWSLLKSIIEKKATS